MSEKACININFDSLGWFFSASPKNFLDFTFFHIADRFFELSNKYGFNYTIFVIGRDLENSAIAERVKEWSRQGHEIGNHTYSDLRLTTMDKESVRNALNSVNLLLGKIVGKKISYIRMKILY